MATREIARTECPDHVGAFQFDETDVHRLVSVIVDHELGERNSRESWTISAIRFDSLLSEPGER